MKRGQAGGLFVNNTFEIVIAVVCVALLVGGGFYVYNNFITNKEEKNAKKTIDEIIVVLDRLENEQTAGLTLQGFSGANNWYLVAWGKEEGPDKCAFDNCLCICKAEYSNGIRGRNPEEGDAQLRSCQDNGICKTTKLPIKVRSSYFFDSQSGIFLDLASTKLNAECIQLKENLYDVTLSKFEDKMDVSYQDREVREEGNYLIPPVEYCDNYEIIVSGK